VDGGLAPGTLPCTAAVFCPFVFTVKTFPFHSVIFSSPVRRLCTFTGL